jgi:hypothetical protein
MRVFRQIVCEFWLSLIISLLWASWRTSTVDVFDFVESFAPSFFLASWALGQVVRIRRQHTVADSLAGLKDPVVGSFTGKASIVSHTAPMRDGAGVRGRM